MLVTDSSVTHLTLQEQTGKYPWARRLLIERVPQFSKQSSTRHRNVVGDKQMTPQLIESASTGRMVDSVSTKKRQLEARMRTDRRYGKRDVAPV